MDRHQPGRGRGDRRPLRRRATAHPPRWLFIDAGVGRSAAGRGRRRRSGRLPRKTLVVTGTCPASAARKRRERSRAGAAAAGSVTPRPTTWLRGKAGSKLAKAEKVGVPVLARRIPRLAGWRGDPGRLAHPDAPLPAGQPRLLAYFVSDESFASRVALRSSGRSVPTRSERGLTFGAFSLSALVLRPLAGRLADRIGRRPCDGRWRAPLRQR